MVILFGGNFLSINAKNVVLSIRFFLHLCLQINGSFYEKEDNMYIYLVVFINEKNGNIVDIPRAYDNSEKAIEYIKKVSQNDDKPFAWTIRPVLKGD